MLKNIKVFILVMALFLFLLSGLGRVHAQFGLRGTPSQQKVEPKLLSSEKGRFVFGQILTPTPVDYGALLKAEK